MQELKLYPTKANLRKGVIYGVITLAFSGLLIAIADELLYYILGPVVFGLGAYLTWISVKHLRTPTPVFEADADGFAVRGKAKRPWSEFRGVEVYTLSTGMFSKAKYVRVKVGSSVMSGNIQIGKTLLSGPAEEMAAEIAGYAQFIERFGTAPAMVQPEPAAAQPQDPMPTATPSAQRPTPHSPPLSFAERLSAHHSSPVASVPTLAERLFGRRKDLI